ncbi:MAG: YdcF family protein [Proteobacteria bacterium]|nr:YdcF family protein [Pseudomonadota bacterium]
MFFEVSKIAWWLLDPGNLLLAILACASVLLWLPRFQRAGAVLASLVMVTWLAVAVIPVGAFLALLLENRFPVRHTLPADVDGIIALGGVVDSAVTQSRGQLSLNSAVERLLTLATLGRRFPDAKLIFTGGSGDIWDPAAKEAAALGPYLADLGLDEGRVIFDNEARNTWENAQNAKRRASPKPGAEWLLVTSAQHMPRAVGAFREAGFAVTPYPVDYHFRADADLRPGFDPVGGLSLFGAAIHEWLGLFAYWVLGRSSAFFPAPDSIRNT